MLRFAAHGRGVREVTAAGGPKVVAFGGGHGLSASLTALREVTTNLTAVVTVADDGGSSGVIRNELDALPPGDLRMALAALAGDDEVSRLWAQVCQHRFGGAATLAGHPVGNLLLTGLSEVTRDPVAALDMAGRLLGSVGRVLPLSVQPIDIVAEVIGLDADDPSRAREVRGQVAVATTPGHVVGVRLDPPSVDACPQAVDAVLDADWVVFGPGSWFTSVIPHLLVPGMLKALTMSQARRVVTMNMSPQSGETEGFSPEAHLQVFGAHAPDLPVDVVLAARRALESGRPSLQAAAESLGATLVIAHLGHDQSIPTHDPQRLAAAYHSIFTNADLTHTEGDSAWR
jgi:uncharacterized cofD-like protein